MINKNEKICFYNKVNELLLKENDYIQIIKGYCENQQDDSEAVARILLIINTICDIHEKLTEDLDNLILNLGI